jgi:hypothetical protein
MTEKSDFTPSQSELHQFWLETWHKKFHEGPYSKEDIAETLFNVAVSIWWSHQKSSEAARRLYLLSLQYAELARELGEYEQQVPGAMPSKH